MKRFGTVLVSILLLASTMSLSAQSKEPSAASSTDGKGGSIWTDEELEAYGAECVEEAKPDIIRIATTELRIELAGSKAAEETAVKQRDAALADAGAERKRARALEVGGIIAAWVGAVLFVVDFIFGWWRFGS